MYNIIPQRYLEGKNGTEVVTVYPCCLFLSQKQREQDEQAGKLLAGQDSETVKKQQLELYNKYQK